MSTLALELKPQDVAVMLKLISRGPRNWQSKELAVELMLSNSELSASFQRIALAGMMEPGRMVVNTHGFLSYLLGRFKDYYPVKKREMCYGFPFTPTVAEDDRMVYGTKEMWVWKEAGGNVYGMGVEPFFPQSVRCARYDSNMYQLLGLCEAIRVSEDVEELTLMAERLGEIFYHYRNCWMAVS